MASPILPGSGLGSGLDIGAIVTALVNADKSAKQTQIDRQTKLTTTSLSGVGTLKSVLAAFQTAMKNLGNTKTPQFSGFARQLNPNARETAPLVEVEPSSVGAAAIYDVAKSLIRSYRITMPGMPAGE